MEINSISNANCCHKISFNIYLKLYNKENLSVLDNGFLCGPCPEGTKYEKLSPKPEYFKPRPSVKNFLFPLCLFSLKYPALKANKLLYQYSSPIEYFNS